METKKLRWGILSTGAIAKTFARGVLASKTGTLVAVGSRSQAGADAFADEFKIPHRHASYEALMADPEVDALYIATPHPMHAELAIQGAQAGKHLLVEKPIGLNHAQAMAIIEAAIANNVFLMEAFMYRCHPQTAKLVELIKEKAIGEVRVIQATFAYHSNFNPSSRTFNNALAGGGILDVGCYTASISRLIAGAAIGKDFSDPTDLKAVGHLGATGVDEWTIASAKFPGDILAQLSTAVGVNQENVVRIYGTEGRITLPNPWQANRQSAEPGQIIVHRNGEKEPREIVVEAAATSFAYEADVFGNAVLSGKKQAPSPAMSWDDTLGNLKLLDRWREAIGLTYESEKGTHYAKTTVAARPLQKSPGAVMKYGKIPHVDKPVSRLIMGVDNQNTFPHVAVMFDDFFERGGNTFDTAHIYNSTRESLLGQWVNLRGVREQVVIITKGAHTPFCEPKFLSSQLIESLDRQKTGYADIYMMHRDNPTVPAGEFIDCLNEHLRAGRIKAFGGSNWSLARVDEANAYAQKTNQRGFSVVSNNFSLARMVNPVWDGCVGANDPEAIAWFTRTQIPLLSWSSQARGFFLEGRAHPDKRDDEELVRCWYADDNFERLKRVNELAKTKGVLPINIAAAFVLHQPFPTFALIGPRLLSETRTSLAALTVELTGDEVKWLNLQ